MAREGLLTIRVNTDDRQMLKSVAGKMERTESDAVRTLVRQAAREMGVVEASATVAQHKEQHEQLAT